MHSAAMHQLSADNTAVLQHAKKRRMQLSALSDGGAAASSNFEETAAIAARLSMV